MPRLLLASGVLLFALALALTLLLEPKSKRATTLTVPVPGRSTTQSTTTTTTTTTQAPPPAPPPPPSVPFSWTHAGGLIVHPGDVDPAWLAQQMRGAGFAWVALDLSPPPDPGWIARFRAASGLPVGGWSVLGGDPRGDASAAASLIEQDGLSFYIADAEEPYGYTDLGTTSDTRYARSRVFVTAFRKLEASLPAAVSSYCRPDQHDLDWSAWVKGGFEFLPQAYVNDFGDKAAPATCVTAAAKWFPKSKVHPTVGSYSGMLGFVQPARWVQLLQAAGTTGFSIYPAEVGMSAEDWQAYASALPALAATP